MKDLFCKVDGCEDVIKARGMCEKHLQRVYRYGDPFHRIFREEKEKCGVKSCSKWAHYQEGYCHFHRYRYKKFGDPLIVKMKRLCSVEGCFGKNEGLHLCRKHYLRALKYGSPFYGKKGQKETEKKLKKKAVFVFETDEGTEEKIMFYE